MKHEKTNFDDSQYCHHTNHPGIQICEFPTPRVGQRAHVLQLQLCHRPGAWIEENATVLQQRRERCCVSDTNNDTCLLQPSNSRIKKSESSSLQPLVFACSTRWAATTTALQNCISGAEGCTGRAVLRRLSEMREWRTEGNHGWHFCVSENIKIGPNPLMFHLFMFRRSKKRARTRRRVARTAGRLRSLK